MPGRAIGAVIRSPRIAAGNIFAAQIPKVTLPPVTFRFARAKRDVGTRYKLVIKGAGKSR
jgi:hypothetical protein